MKKTQWIDLWKTIRKSIVSYFAVMLFAALGIALFIGLGWGSRALENSADAEFDKYRFHDLEILFPYGLEEEDLNELKRTDGVLDAEGTRYSDQMFFLNGRKEQARVIGITERVDLLCGTEGVLPGASDEIAVQKCWAAENGVRIGDRIIFEHDAEQTEHLLSRVLAGGSPLPFFADGDGMKYLLSDTFTVTALVGSPAYESTNPAACGVSEANSVPLSCVMFVSPAAFDEASFTGYNDVLIRAEGLDGSFVSDEYRAGCGALAERVRAVLDGLTQRKNARLREAFSGIPGAEMPEVNGAILSREDNGGAAFLRENAAGSEKLRYSLALMLVLIGLLVCYSAVTRLVNDHRVLIGARKALGFTDREITAFYLLYSGSAAAAGSVLGTLTGWLIVEPFVFAQMKNNFMLQTEVSVFLPAEALIMISAEILLILLSAALACRGVLRQDAVRLTAGTQPPVIRNRFFERTVFWKRLPLVTKTVVNNCFTDRRRVFATLIGIIGCTSLVACGVFFRNSITGSAGYHYANIQKYDAIIYYDAKDETGDRIGALAQKYGIPCCRAGVSSGAFRMPDGKKLASRLITAEEEGFREMFSLRTADRKAGALSDGPWISLPLSCGYRLGSGDRMNYTDSEGKEHTITVGNVQEYYISDLVLLMDEDTCEKQLGRRPDRNAFLIISEGKDMDAFNAALNETEGYLFTDRFRENSIRAISALSGSLSALSLLYLAMSFAMAVLVILNLLHTFVHEKERELVTLMVNGYSVGQAKKYIWSDTVFLTAVGILIGLIAGILIGRLSVEAVSVGSMCFVLDTDIAACLIAAAVTALLTFVMSRISLRDIDRFSLIIH